MSSSEHRNLKVQVVSCAVLTISDSRTPETDKSGSLIRDRLVEKGHHILDYAILPDEPELVRQRVESLIGNPKCQAILLTGGTGLAPRDNTYEALDSLIEKRLDGFGELFRMLSFEEIGAAAMLSRAVAGVCQSTLIFSMPGSPGAVKLALDRLILPQLPHLVALLK